MEKKAERKLSPLFTWRSEICSDDGPEDPITRYVLIALSLHMSELGDSCFPSIALLARETALANRTVRKHLKLAVASGWIVRRVRELRRGQAWRAYEYFAARGRRAAPGAAPSDTEPDNQALTDKVGHEAPQLGDVRHLTPEGAASDDLKVRHQLPLRTSVRTTRGRTAEGAQNCVIKKPESDLTLEQWLEVPEQLLGPSDRAIRAHYIETSKGHYAQTAKKASTGSK